jgi:hypothetical protein
MPEILGREDAAGEGTASAFFGRGRVAAAEVDVRPGIHLIAIRKSVPAPERVLPNPLKAR